MKQSYCGICENCPVDMPDFLKVITKVREYFDQIPVIWWVHCFPGDEGFSFPEFCKGLEWFLSHECLGCKGGGGPKEFPVRLCAITRQVPHCLECQDIETCEHYNIIIKKSSGKIC